MKKIQDEPKYDAWLHWYVTNRCNMNCHYCFDHDKLSKRFDKVQKINIPTLIKILDETNKVFRISLIGGEPFLIPNMVEACAEITKKHYISFNTNLTSTKFKEFCEKIRPEKVLGIYASLHIKELEKHNLTDRYINNFLLCKKKGFNIFAIEVAHPSLLSEVKKYRKFFSRRKIKIGFSPFIGEYNGKKYPESYTKKESKIFELSTYYGGEDIYHQKGKLCNAGYNVGIVRPNGDIIRCFSISDKLGNVYKHITFKDRLIRCPMEVCHCPLNVHARCLLEKALKENTIKTFK